MTPEFLRELAAHWRAIADAAWSAYYMSAGRGVGQSDLERGLAVANQAQKLAYDYERQAERLEASKAVA
jgi:hypothetical protein